VAPLNIGNNVFIAAGSTITDDIPDEAFSIARERQITKEDYARKYNYNKK
jgi:bifunctional UDP-N-acetylglucosamine pyrophosphorylase/glucosamine-1-phosphate N-acetyltransferase